MLKKKTTISIVYAVRFYSWFAMEQPHYERRGLASFSPRDLRRIIEASPRA